MLGDLIAELDRPDVIEAVLATLPPALQRQVEARAADASMTVADFAAGAVREFVDHAGDDLWFQMLTVMRQADDPGIVAVQTILGWVVEPVDEK
jgi:hypothetical protein